MVTSRKIKVINRNKSRAKTLGEPLVFNSPCQFHTSASKRKKKKYNCLRSFSLFQEHCSKQTQGRFLYNATCRTDPDSRNSNTASCLASSERCHTLDSPAQLLSSHPAHQTKATPRQPAHTAVAERKSMF